jgi:type IV pilus assembly protein PilB
LWVNVPAAVQASLALCPLQLDGDVMTVAMGDPRDVNPLETLKLALPGVKMRIVATSPDELARFIRHGTGGVARRQTSTAIPTRTSLPSIAFIGYEEPQTQQKGSRMSTAPTPAVSLVDEIVATGLVHGASDIHLEHERDGVTVRYRIDGILRRRRDRVAPDLARPIVSRLKLLARLDITETRKPQDGRISVRLDNGRMVDLRVSTLPSKFGEKVAMRILDSEAAIRDLRTLFPVERVRHVFSQLISRHTGLVLVSGPTGSGKSTTLYSAVHARRSDDLNIMTVEDPIEYHIDGVTQVEVHAETGTGFAQVLRALLRQDPNIILVGEMRDSETARIAVEASLTGHLVLSSIHTNGAIEAVARMMDMGVEPFAMANGLVGVMHQRLVKRVCVDCAQPFEYPAMVVDQLIRHGVLPEDQSVKLVRGVGCERCHGSGSLGRVAVHAVLLVNDEVREAISNGGDLRTLRAAASSGAHLDLARYAGAILRAGLTVPSEVLPLLQRMET